MRMYHSKKVWLMTDLTAGICIGIGLSICYVVGRSLIRYYIKHNYTLDLLDEGDLCENCLRGEQ